MDAYPSLRAADPADPFYYLQNMETVAGWILAHHCDLLYPEEQQRLQDFLALPQAARALLTRLLMRSGELFPGGPAGLSGAAAGPGPGPADR